MVSIFFYIKREVFLDVKMFETGQNVKMFLNGFRIALSAAVYEAEVAFSCHNTTITMIIMMMIIDLEMVTVVLIRIDNDWDEPKLRVRRGELQHSRPDGSRSREFDARQVGSDRHHKINHKSWFSATYIYTVIKFQHWFCTNMCHKMDWFSFLISYIVQWSFLLASFLCFALEPIFHWLSIFSGRLDKEPLVRFIKAFSKSPKMER